MPKDSYDKRTVYSWAMYDWANSAFSTTVMAGFFPIFFKQYWSSGADVHVSTFYLGMANATASIAVAILAPILGSVADQGGVRKRFLLCFCGLGVMMTGLLFAVQKGDWFTAALFYVLAVIGFAGGNVFYDSLIVAVAPKPKLDSVSALGYSLGYLGGGLLFALNVLMTLKPQLFGLSDAAAGVRLSFLTVAVWWAAFALPLSLFVKEARSPGSMRVVSIMRGSFNQLVATFREIRRFRTVFLFLVAYWLYIDGVDTVILMAVDYGLSLGFDYTVLIQALLITQFVGFPAAIVFGKIGERMGTKTGIFIGLAVYIGVAVWGYFMRRQVEFYVLAIGIGLVQGGVQSLSRSYFARLIPAERSAEFFGFYNMLGKFAAIIGPFLMGWVSMTTGNPRYSIFAVIGLFVAGGIVLYSVKDAPVNRTV
jgi:MFS transporter, UMF1 family